MFQIMIYMFTMMSGLIFLMTNHPLAMGLMLLVQTLLICLITGLMTSNFWFSYILFLIFLGGMLVLFIYVSSLASNEMFSMSLNTLFLMLLMLNITLFTLMIIDNYLIINFLENNEMINLTKTLNYLPENMLNLSKLYNFPTNFITLLLVNYLLITLIAIVKITNMFYGPLRQSH